MKFKGKGQRAKGRRLYALPFAICHLPSAFFCGEMSGCWNFDIAFECTKTYIDNFFCKNN